MELKGDSPPPFEELLVSTDKEAGKDSHIHYEQGGTDRYRETEELLLVVDGESGERR